LEKDKVKGDHENNTESEIETHRRMHLEFIEQCVIFH
jgi:hypothetical protein